jgi:hypothetical protein
MPFLPGKSKTGGRQPGVPNRLTTAFREAVQIVYEGLGGHAAFLQWARENPTEFYRIASRLVPAEMRDDGGNRKVTVIVDRSCGANTLPAAVQMDTTTEE